MENSINTIKDAEEFVEKCLVPDLKYDLTTAEVRSEDFTVFKNSLGINLECVFEILNKNEATIFENVKETLSLRIKLLRVLCEQSSSNNPFKRDDQQILKIVLDLLEVNFPKYYSGEEIINNVFDVYKSKLNNNGWTKSIGSIYGFLRFCEVCKLIEFFNLNEE